MLNYPGPASRLKCQFWIRDRDGGATCRLTVGHTGAHEVEAISDARKAIPKPAGDRR